MKNIAELLARTFLLPALTLTLAIQGLPSSADDSTGKTADAKVSAAQPEVLPAPSAVTETGPSVDCTFDAGAPATVPTTSVKTAALTTERQLRLLGEAVKRVRKAASDLAAECTQPVEMMGEIDIIGTDVIPIMPATSEGFGTQYIPPRPKYVNLHMAQLTNLVPILDEDLAAINVPAPEKDFATPLLTNATTYVGDIKTRFAKLQGLTKPGTNYDANAIVNECRAIHGAANAIDETRKKLLHEDKKLEKGK